MRLTRLLSLPLALSLLSAAPAGAQDAADEAAAPPVNLRPDERRAHAPFSVELFDRPVELRLGYELSMEQRRNFDLNQARDRDRRTRDQELKADARMKLTPRVTLFAQAVAISEVRHQRATGLVTRDEGLQRGELWASVDQLAGTPLALQAGRIPLVDSRTWWWDDDLDAARLMWRGPSWYAETGFGRELARKASYEPGIALQHRGVRRWFGQASWNWTRRQSLELFWLRASDRSGSPLPGALLADNDADEHDGRLSWLGLRGSGNGRLAGGQRWAYWADLGLVRGRETLTTFSDAAGGLQRAGATNSRRLRGQALDLGATWTFSELWRPTLTLGWAAGSGSAPGAAVNRNYRQTGLQENKVRLSGMKRLQRYGELFDPELSNLRVATASFGLRVLPETSIELAAHHYRQRVAAPVVADMRLSQLPAGISPRLGHELDLLFAWRPTSQLELMLLLARFLPGDAFAANRRDPATSIELGLDIKF